MYVRRKTSPGRTDYYQLVESRRVEGKPRQKVLAHLGEHPTIEAALKTWPRQIGSLRRRGHPQEADALKAKLEHLRGVLPKDPWRVAKELEASEGVRWIRAALGRYSWDRCQFISVGFWQWRGGDTTYWLKGLCVPPFFDNEGYRLYVKVSEDSRYPRRNSSGPVIRNEDEAFVFLAAHEAAHFLYCTRQLRGDNTEPECNDFASKMLEAFRRDVPNPRPRLRKRPEWPGNPSDYEKHLLAMERGPTTPPPDTVPTGL